MLGIMQPSTTLALWATRWSHSRRDTLGVRAFKTGLAPLTLGLLLATGWILADPVRDRPAAIVLIAVTVAVMLKTRLSPLWLVAAGAVVGALGWI
jgi:chromate transporter